MSSFAPCKWNIKHEKIFAALVQQRDQTYIDDDEIKKIVRRPEMLICFAGVDSIIKPYIDVQFDEIRGIHQTFELGIEILKELTMGTRDDLVKDLHFNPKIESNRQKPAWLFMDYNGKVAAIRFQCDENIHYHQKTKFCVTENDFKQKWHTPFVANIYNIDHLTIENIVGIWDSQKKN